MGENVFTAWRNVMIFTGFIHDAMKTDTSQWADIENELYKYLFFSK